MELAERGDMHSLHEYADDVAEGINKEEDSWYSNITNQSRHDDPVFLYGKAVGKTIGTFEKNFPIQIIKIITK